MFDSLQNFGKPITVAELGLSQPILIESPLFHSGCNLSDSFAFAAAGGRSFDISEGARGAPQGALRGELLHSQRVLEPYSGQRWR